MRCVKSSDALENSVSLDQTALDLDLHCLLKPFQAIFKVYIVKGKLHKQ